MSKDDNPKDRRRRRPYKLNISTLAPGEENEELAIVQSFLDELGYLTPGYRPAVLDDPTQQALRKYQAYNNLRQTGTTDQETVKKMEQPRCGTEDPVDRLRLEGDEFLLDAFAAGIRIRCNLVGIDPVTYTIANTSAELPGELTFDQVRAAIEEALNTWEATINVNFEPAQAAANAVLKFKWATGNHGDNKKFDITPGGIIAHAFFPRDCGGTFAGQCHFDRAERWGLIEIPNQRTFDLETVALHEIGHLLGLSHTSATNSIMHASHLGQRREVSTDARAAAVGVYGAREP